MIVFLDSDCSPLAFTVFGHSAVGPLTVSVDGRGAVVSVEWGDTRPAGCMIAAPQTVGRIEAFITGVSTDVEVSPRGVTALQLAVMKAVSGILPGDVISYSELARLAGYPRAVRAVASAVGRNPIPVIVPCHRVLPLAGVKMWRLNGPEVAMASFNLGHYTPDDRLKPLLLGHDIMLKKT